jgi:hypothetical protein
MSGRTTGELIAELQRRSVQMSNDLLTELKIKRELVAALIRCERALMSEVGPYEQGAAARNAAEVIAKAKGES